MPPRERNDEAEADKGIKVRSGFSEMANHQSSSVRFRIQ